MHPITSQWVRRAALALTFAASAATPALAAAPSSRIAVVDDVTERDVAQSNAKPGDAYGALVKMWTDDFGHVGRRFVAPRLVRYRGGARTACGTMGAGNAAYCY